VVGSIKVKKGGVTSVLDLEVAINGSTLVIEDESGDYRINVSRDSIGGGLYPGTFVFIEGQSATPITIEEITIDWP
jgi:hypothetical protein